ncbi:30149_t:CDS:2 [Gigaspora margarita]|uniref:30149_t:CDS:1 n=1 Tax=Gigaspora margarita TaxID=4874 RepID=A0ABN7UH38_GIGMA|nr:30149_t:CDS:2 [Gigaspora margarita]
MSNNLNIQTIPTEFFDLALILHSRIKLKTCTGDVKAKIKSFYDAIEHALQDTLLDIQKQEKLEHLKETPEVAQAQLKSLDLALILHSRIELKTCTGDVKAKIKSFYDAIEHALQDT